MKYSLVVTFVSLLSLANCHGEELPSGAIARLGNSAFKYAEFQRMLGFSPDGKKLFTTSWARGWFSQWDMLTGKVTNQFILDDGLERPVAVSVDGKLFATVRVKKHVVIRRVEDGTTLLTIKDNCPNDRGYNAAFSSDSKMLAIDDEWGGMRLYEVSTGKLLKSPLEDGKRTALALQDVAITGFHFSSDSKRLTVCKRMQTPLVWDIPADKIITKSVRREEAAAFDGLARKNNEWISVTNDREKKYSESHKGNDGSFGTSSWNAFHGTVRIHDQDTLKVTKTIDIPFGVESASVSMDGRFLAVLGHGSLYTKGATLGVWSLMTGKPIGKIDLGEQRADMAFTPNGSMLVVAGHSTFRRFEVGTSQEKPVIEVAPTKVGTEKVNSLLFTSDGKQLLSVGRAGVTAWDISTGLAQQTFGSEDYYSGNVAALVPGNDALWLGTGGKANRWVYSEHQWKQQSNSLHSQWYFISLALAPDGSNIATGARKTEMFRIKGDLPKTLGIYDKSGNQIRIDSNTASDFDTADILQMSYSPDGSKLGMAADRRHDFTKTVVLLSVKEGYKVCNKFKFSFGPINSFAYSPDGKVIAIVGGDIPSRRGLDDGWEAGIGGVELWRPDVKEVPIKLKGHKGRVRSVTFSRDGSYVITGGDDRMVRIWEVRTGKELKKLGGHEGAVTAVAFSPDSKLLATGSADTTILLWDWKQLER